MTRPSIVACADDERAFERMLAGAGFASRGGHPVYGPYGRAYYRAYHGNAWRDLSFALLIGGRPRALVECDVAAGTVARCGKPVRVTSAPGSDSGEDGSIESIFAHLDDLAQEDGVNLIRIADLPPAATVSALGAACLARSARPEIIVEAVADLAPDDDHLRRDLRKSFRSLVNWGRRSMRLRYLNRLNPERALFDAFRDLHRAAAGKVTRNDASWEVQYETIVAGHGELVIGTIDGEDHAVSGAIVIDGEDTAIYSTAAYDRSRFDKPLAHWPLFDAMLRARQRGMRWFELGEVPSDADADRKSFTVGRFKKGFTSRLEQRLVWTWRPGVES